MKKLTKAIMALMLSLVMIFGCIPSFTNVVNADGPNIENKSIWLNKDVNHGCISLDNCGNYVTITVYPNDGYKLKNIYSVYKDSQNKTEDQPVKQADGTYTLVIDRMSGNVYVYAEFEPANSGGSKKYKANDNGTAEKISGSGKKGSKRIITPKPNRKVESIIVTDKNGNKYEVTNEGDGTYSFIQPRANVNVEVKYKNRLIELTIGSFDASVDDVHHNLDVVPKVVNDRTMLPIRFIAENLGAKVDWDENDPDSVIITRGDTKIEITLGSDKAYVNGEEYIIDSVAFAENDRTYLPVRFVSEKLNAIVEWNESHPMDVKIYERQ